MDNGNAICRRILQFNVVLATQSLYRNAFTVDADDGDHYKWVPAEDVTFELVSGH